jgi:hypothetical protein
MWGSNLGKGKGFIFLQDVQTSLGAHPASYSVGTGVFLGVRGQVVKFTAHFHPVHGLRMGGAITLLPLNAFVVWAGANLPF